jgi:hypothetical protein
LQEQTVSQKPVASDHTQVTASWHRLRELAFSGLSQPAQVFAPESHLVQGAEERCAA